MATYQDLDPIHRPSTGGVSPAAWGDAVNDNFAFLAAGDTAIVDTAEATASTSFANLSTVGPAVTVTTGANALVIVSCLASCDTALAFTLMGFAVSGASTIAPSDDRSWTYGNPLANNAPRFSMVVFQGLTAGANVFTAKYRTTGGTSTFVERRITVLPFP